MSNRTVLNQAGTITQDWIARFDVSVFGMAQRLIRSTDYLRLKTYPGITGEILRFEAHLKNRAGETHWYPLFRPISAKGQEWR